MTTCACVAALDAGNVPLNLSPTLAPGAAVPFGAIVTIFTAGQAARYAVARSQGAVLKPPVLIPSTQVGTLGFFFPEPATPSPSRAAAMVLALAGPLAMAAMSLLLILASDWPALHIFQGTDVTLQVPVKVVWPMASLPESVNPLVWAGMQGLLSASLALLPHSPSGQTLIGSLYGRDAAKKLANISGYGYVVASFFASWFYGLGWVTLPLWWYFLTINTVPPEQTPPQEELSEIPVAVSVTTHLAMAAAALFLWPWPLFQS